MPIKVNGYRTVCIPKRSRVELFKKETRDKKTVVYRGTNLIKDSKFNPLHVFAFRFVDMMSSVFEKHPKIGKILMNINEKILRNADCLK